MRWGWGGGAYALSGQQKNKPLLSAINYQQKELPASGLEYHLLLPRDLNFLTVGTHETLTAQTVEIKRMLTSFIQKLRAEN